MFDGAMHTLALATRIVFTGLGWIFKGIYNLIRAIFYYRRNSSASSSSGIGKK